MDWVFAALAFWFGVTVPPGATQQKSPAGHFHPLSRQVDNWRFQAADHLEINWGQQQSWRLQALAPELMPPPASLPRCIVLNNYWCIKKAGWIGDIASDRDGHIAFGTPDDGAIVAALLLKRYYVDWNWHDAWSIVSHWAPAQCSTAAANLGGAPLSKRGIGNTLRARYLARRGRKLTPSRILSHPTPLLRTPTIAIGMGEAAKPLAVVISSMSLRTLPKVGAVSGFSCPAEDQRMHAYARALAKDIAQDETTDLHLFAADGTPTPALSRAMRNMANVEIGPYRVAPALIDQAIEHAQKILTRQNQPEQSKP